MINIKNIKTIPQSVDHLNRVILGMSETNQVIPKAYTSAFPVQERLDGLEEKSNDTLADISALNGEISALNEVVEELLTATEDTGWINLTVTNTSIDQSNYNMYIRKIGKVVTISGSFLTTGTMNPYPSTNIVATMPDNTYAPKSGASQFSAYYKVGNERTEIALTGTTSSLQLYGSTVPSGAYVYIPNITYITNR